MPESSQIEIEIISGGQTGADRAALDFAIEQGIPHSGWCPSGRRAEDGPIPLIYHLEETPSHRYDQRTKWNVRDSDATLVLTIDRRASRGSGLTLGIARKLARPHLHLAKDAFRRSGPGKAGGLLRLFLLEHHVRQLNVAGPRASQEPHIAKFVQQVLAGAIRPCQDHLLEE